MTTARPVLCSELPTPIGPILLTGDGEAITGVRFADPAGPAATAGGARRDDERLGPARRQLAEFLEGRRTAFDLPLRAAGTPFQRAVWDLVRTIPYGGTASYGALAARIGRPGAARAVGLANARNPIAILVPCHRVVGASGALTGYAAGVERKRWLLDLEAGAPDRRRPTGGSGGAPGG